MRTRSSGHTGLALLLLATALTVANWFPAPRAEAIPETIVRRVAVDASSLDGPGLRAAGAGRVAAAAASVTEARVVCAPIRFTSVGLTWDQASGRSPGAVLEAGETVGTLGRPLHLHDAEGPDLGTADARKARRGTDPVWVESARCLRFRLEIPAGVTLSNLEIVFLNSSGTAGVPTAWHPAPAGAATGGGPGVASAQANAPYWITRAGWGANESLKNCEPSYADQLKMAFVHHTATENGYAMDKADDIVRSIYTFHTEGRGWCDIAYNFLVDRFGRVFVGRAGGPARNVIGAAQQGFNTGAVSVAGIGTYGATAPNSMVFGIKKTLAWRLDVAHLPPKGWAWMVSGGGPNTKYAEGTGVTLPLVSGHRNTGYTDCPGDKLFSLLGAIRQSANDIGLPKMWRTKASAYEFEPGLETVHFTANASVSLSWTVTVVSQATGQTLRTWRPVGTTLDVEWSGMNGLFPVADGPYTVTIAGTNANGGMARPAVLVVTVGSGSSSGSEPQPEPSASPTTVP